MYTHTHVGKQGSNVCIIINSSSFNITADNFN